MVEKNQTRKRKLFRKIKKYKVYLIILGGFFVWISLFDSTSLWRIYDYKKRIKNLKEEKLFYLQKIAEDSIKLANIRSKRNIERYARERYFMKSDDEDVFVIVSKK